MYYYIKGILTHKSENFLVVETGGVGYLINSSLTSIMDAGGAGGEITVYTHLNVREDAMDLYGFTTIEEKNMFSDLLSVSGVGPKAALAVLSVANPSGIAVAVMTDDVKTITKASGVGPKMAQRIILELKDKLKTADLQLPDNSGTEADSAVSDNRNEAISALVSLGYNPQEAQKALKGIDSSLSVEDIVKRALASLF